MSAEFLQSLVGRWQGSCRTWLEPGELADESSIQGQISTITPCVVEHRYQTTMRGSARTGQEWIAWNSVTGDMETSWVDSFHMNYGILVSRGNLDENQASVCGHYAVGPDHPDWKWRTDFTVGPSALTIVSYNVSPEGEAAKAIEVVYQRID